MATTATISASTATPVVGRSMNLIGTSGTSKISNSSKTAKAVPAPVTTVSHLSQAALMSLPSPPASVSAPSPPGSASDDDLVVLPTPCASAEVSPVASPAASPVASPETKTVPLPEDPEESAGHSSSTPTTTSSTVAATKTSPAPSSSSTLSAEATTFFDDMINAPQPPANILSLSPTTTLPDLYHDFFDNHPELYDSDQSSDPEMDLEDLDSPLIRARTMADLRRETVPTM
ncbi:hypothetical protein BG005_007100 [Podila minutissima]|nr:hypothetical protein BG005_007100 [Podila minutissima]